MFSKSRRLMTESLEHRDLMAADLGIDVLLDTGGDVPVSDSPAQVDGSEGPWLCGNGVYTNIDKTEAMVDDQPTATLTPANGDTPTGTFDGVAGDDVTSVSEHAMTQKAVDQAFAGHFSSAKPSLPGGKIAR